MTTARCVPLRRSGGGRGRDTGESGHDRVARAKFVQRSIARLLIGGHVDDVVARKLGIGVRTPALALWQTTGR
ncbi:hypothetical protein [Streptomyces sp. NPDC048411]|uniref:hypothetical protein n=1 Tax=Streptomyces sp. NPDC048411 TaxID=3157206 RepID=UPI003453FB13